MKGMGASDTVLTWIWWWWWWCHCRDVGSEDSDPEVKDVPEVKEVPVSDVSSVRHLLDMDMDDVKANVFAHTNIDWDPVASDAVKSGKLHDATKTETVIDVGEVHTTSPTWLCLRILMIHVIHGFVHSHDMHQL